MPGAYVERMEIAERAQSEREAAEAEQAAKAHQKALEREQRAAAEQESAHLDAMWDKLDAKTRERLDTEARKRLGPVAQAGLLRGGNATSGALAAMRRNLMRELLAGATQGSE